MVFGIEGINLSQFVVAGTYEVNSEDVTEDWENARGQLNKQKLRDIITGSFDMFFIKKSDYEAFISLIEEKKNINGYLRCTVSVNNRVANKEVTDNFFLDFKPKRDRQADGRDCYKQFKVNIRQR